jgi:hypothetical protein
VRRARKKDLEWGTRREMWREDMFNYYGPRKLKNQQRVVFGMVKVANGWDFRGFAGRRRWRRCEGCYTVGGLRVNGERRG